MRRLRILAVPVLGALLAPAAALAAPGDPYVVYTANNYADGAVILRTDPAAGFDRRDLRNGPQGSLFSRPYDWLWSRAAICWWRTWARSARPPSPLCRGRAHHPRRPDHGRQSLLAGGALLSTQPVSPGSRRQRLRGGQHEAVGSGRVIRIDPASGAQT